MTYSLRCLIWISLLATMAWSCGDGDEPIAAQLGAGLDLPETTETQGILPAYQADAELDEEGKEDALSVRASHEELYGFTGAPPFGSRSVAEWELTEGVLISWESSFDDYFTELVAALEPAIPVHIITPSTVSTRRVRDILDSAGVATSELRFFEYRHESFWTRDYGPITVELPDGGAAFIDTRYYAYRDRDDALPTLMSRYFELPVYRPSLASEGGNFMTNGEGLCVTTGWMIEENLGLTEAEILARMERYFGCEQTLILEILDGEGTGHVDMFAKFTSPDTVLVGWYDERDQPRNAAILDRNAQALAGIRLPSGRDLRVIRIPMPEPDPPVYGSYTNSLIVNGRAVVPSYDWSLHLEEEVRAAYLEAMPPGSQVLFVDSSEVIEYGGSIHCTTMTFNISPATAAPDEDSPNRFEAAPFAPIRDHRTTDSALVVPGDNTIGPVGSVAVSLDISHSYIGDLTITLSHGDRERELFRGEGPGTDLVGVVRTDAYAGMNAAGTWLLRVTDSADNDEGVLNAWAIEFTDL